MEAQLHRGRGKVHRYINISKWIYIEGTPGYIRAPGDVAAHTESWNHAPSDWRAGERVGGPPGRGAVQSGAIDVLVLEPLRPRPEVRAQQPHPHLVFVVPDGVGMGGGRVLLWVNKCVNIFTTITNYS